MTVAIIGMGLIGGSIALGLKNNGFAKKILGVDIDEKHAKEALSLGLVDEMVSLNDAQRKADLIVLAVPVDAILKMLPELLDSVDDNTVITDMGSTKEAICKAIRHHKRRKNFVASHPIAGTENMGPAAAVHNLFDDKITIMCDTENSSQKALQIVREMCLALNMRITFMDAIAHDIHIAYVSHLSHISSFVLGLTVLEKEKDEQTIFNMASSGFASTVRLAKSSPDMWVPIFEQNAKHISKTLDAYIQNLIKFKNLIDENDLETQYQLLEQANDVRRILKGIK